MPKNVYNTAEPIGIFTFGEPYKEDDTMMLDVTVYVVALTDQTLRDFLDYCELAYNPQTSHIHAVYPQDIKTSELKAKFEEHGIKILGTKKKSPYICCHLSLKTLPLEKTIFVWTLQLSSNGQPM